MPEPVITILVALWKAGRFLDAKLKNLEQQTLFDRCNIVLLNCQNLEGEADIYADFLAEHDNATEIRYSQHMRLYPTWNDGIKATKSEFIMNSNVDDMLHPQYIEKCTEWLGKNPNFSVVSSKIITTDVPNQVWPNWGAIIGIIPFKAYPKSTAGPCPVWRRLLHSKYGYFGNYRTIGDAKMWEKWYAGSEQFGLIDEKLVLYLASSQSLERRVDCTTMKSYRDLDIEETKKGDGPKNL